MQGVESIAQEDDGEWGGLNRRMMARGSTSQKDDDEG